MRIRGLVLLITLVSIGLVTASASGLGSFPALESPVLPPQQPPLAGNRTIAAWGDSETYGDQDDSGVSYPSLLQGALGSGFAVENFGDSGYTATDTRLLAGAGTFSLHKFTVSAAAAPTKAEVTITGGVYTPTGIFHNDYDVGEAWPGVLTVGGVEHPGILHHHIIGTGKHLDTYWTWERADTGSSYAVPAHAIFNPNYYDAYRGSTTLIDVGRVDFILNPAHVVADAKIMVAHLTTTHYLVLSVLPKMDEVAGTSGAAYVRAVNTGMKKAFGSHYLDVSDFIIRDGMAYNGLRPTKLDKTLALEGAPPKSLLASDEIHPNKYGYRAEAFAVLRRMQLLNWVSKAATVPAV